MLMNKRNYVIVLVIGLVFFSSPVFAGAVSSQLPLDSWVYPALDKLEGLGLIDSSLKGNRPYTRLEAARLAAAAQDQLDVTTLPVADELLVELRRELAPELAELGGTMTGGYLRPLRDLRFVHAWHEGEESAILGTNARQFALDRNRQGIDFADGHSGLLSLESEARLSKWLLVAARPQVLLRETNKDAELELLDGRVALGLGPIEFSFGRQSLWWGQGRNGTLLLSNNAQPLDMLRITNPSPLRLPWIFKYLGPLRFDVFWSQLEGDRVVPDPYFSGVRLNFKPLSWLEIGGGRTTIFGGEGRPDVGLSEFLTILTGKNLSGREDTSNQLAGIDARVTLPFLWQAEFYSELAGEDEAGAFISKHALLAGLFLPRIEPSGRLALRIEYTDLAFNGAGPVWYRHSQYRSGYTYQGRLLGHHQGGDSRGLFFQLSGMFPGRISATLDLDYQERGLSQPHTETHLQPALNLSWQASEGWRLSGHFALDRVDNVDFVTSDQGTNYFTLVSLDYRM